MILKYRVFLKRVIPFDLIFIIARQFLNNKYKVQNVLALMSAIKVKLLMDTFGGIVDYQDEGSSTSNEH